MIDKIKVWLFGSVIIKKVIGKFAKHATTAIIGLVSSPAVAPWLGKLGVDINPDTLEAGLFVVLTGLFGAAWNFVEHRVSKKK